MPTDLAGYLGTVENGRTFGPLAGDTGVGTFGGSEDHTAILCCRASTLSQYRFAPVLFEREVAMPAGHVFAVAFSGLLAEKTGAALATYNRASRSAARVLQIWRDTSGRRVSTLEAAVVEDDGGADAIRAAIAASDDEEFGADLLRKRFDQFVLESRTIVPGAGDALRDGDLGRFGALVDRSQQAVEEWLGNQVPETVCLAREARRLGGAAASAFGAGFGGSVWALVEEARSERVPASVASGLRARPPGGRRPGRLLRNGPGSGGVPPRLRPAAIRRPGASSGPSAHGSRSCRSRAPGSRPPP